MPTLAVLALVALVAAILTAVVHYRPRPERLPLPGPAADAPEPAPEAPTATALIDAIPWGRIERIVSTDGRRADLPAERETPSLLELPAGDWRVVLSNPRFEEERICELRLVERGRADCLVEFERLSVDQYFRETGWWR